MWRLLIMVAIGTGIWASSQVLPGADGEQELRSIVNIAVRQPGADDPPPTLLPDRSTPDDGPSIEVIPMPAAPNTVDLAYLPEGAGPATTGLPGPNSRPEVRPASAAEPPTQSKSVIAPIPVPVPTPRAAETPSSVTIAVAPPPATLQPPMPRADVDRKLIRALQRELVRVGCLQGKVTGAWDEATQSAVGRFAAALNASIPANGPDAAALAMLEKHQGGACDAVGQTMIAMAVNEPVPQPIPAPQPAAKQAPTPQPKVRPVEPPTVLAANEATELTSGTIEFAPVPAPAPIVTVPIERPKVPAPRPTNRMVAAEASATQQKLALVTPRRTLAPEPKLQIRQPNQAGDPSRVAAKPAALAARAVARQRRVADAPRRPSATIRQAQRNARRASRSRLAVVRRYPSYRVLQASLFRPFVVFRPLRTRVQTVRYRRSIVRPAWTYSNGSPPGTPRWLR